MPHPLYERESDLQALADASRLAREGQGNLVLVTGEAGIGKTALVRRFVAGHDDLRMISGFGEPTSTVRPLGVFHDLSLSLSGALRDAVRESAPPWRLYEALLEDLAVLPELPLIWVEDAQWADQATLEALRYLLRRCGALRVLLVVSLRSDDARAPAVRETLLQSVPVDHWRELCLARLCEATVRQMAEGAGFDAEELFRLTRGNPLFLTSTLRWTQRSVPDSLARLAREKLAGLDAPSAALIRKLSIHAERIDADEMRRLAEAAPGALATCVAQNWLVLREGWWSFEHELLRRAVVDSIAPEERARMHAELLRQPLTAVQATHHALHAMDRPRLAREAPVAALAAMQAGAFREAAAYWQMALTHAQPSPHDRAQWSDQLGWCLVHSGDSVAGLKAIESGRRDWLALGDADGVLRNMASALRWPQRVRAAMTLFTDADIESALAAPFKRAQAFDRAILNIELCRRTALAHRFGEARTLLDRVRERLDEVDELPSRTELRWWIAWMEGYYFCEMPGDSLDEIIETGDRLDLEHFVSQAQLMQLGFALFGLDPRKALDHYAVAVRRCEQRDLSAARQLFDGLLAFVHLERAQFDACLQQVRSMEQAMRTVTPIADFLQFVCSLAQARSGEPADDEALDAALERSAKNGNVMAVASAHWQAAECCWLRGRRDEARERLRAGRQIVSAVHSPRTLPYWQSMSWLEAVLDKEDAGAGRTSSSDADLREQSRLWQARGMPYPAAMVLAGGSAALRRRALTLLQAIGAQGAIEALQRHWALIGLESIPRGAHRATLRNPAALTRREIQLLAMLARGLSNQQIATQWRRSARTVEHHLSAILSKTGTRSRLEVLAWARERDLC